MKRLAAVRVGTSALVGLLAALVALTVGAKQVAPMIGWDTAAVVFVLWLGSVVARSDEKRTSDLAQAEDSSKAVTDLVLLTAAVASLVGVGLLLTEGAQKNGPSPALAITVSLVSVVLSWSVVHLVFTTRYAQLYFAAPEGGIDFNEDDPPLYLDFAYLAFTIGMTFQVSDTNLKTKPIRGTALRHALLSYAFGAVILATTINLVAGLAK